MIISLYRDDLSGLEVCAPSLNQALHFLRRKAIAEGLPIPQLGHVQEIRVIEEEELIAILRD